jgi:hypothetical protein
LFEKAGMLAASLKDLDGIEVVLSCNWAAYHPKGAILALFLPWPELQKRVVGCTVPWTQPPRHGAVVPERERRCRDWLRANGRSAQHWLAIDNQGRHFAARDRLVLVDGRKGLQVANLYRLLALIQRLRRD